MVGDYRHWDKMASSNKPCQIYLNHIQNWQSTSSQALFQLLKLGIISDFMLTCNFGIIDFFSTLCHIACWLILPEFLLQHLHFQASHTLTICAQVTFSYIFLEVWARTANNSLFLHSDWHPVTLLVSRWVLPHEHPWEAVFLHTRNTN